MRSFCWGEKCTISVTPWQFLFFGGGGWGNNSVEVLDMYVSPPLQVRNCQGFRDIVCFSPPRWKIVKLDLFLLVNINHNEHYENGRIIMGELICSSSSFHFFQYLKRAHCDWYIFIPSNNTLLWPLCIWKMMLHKSLRYSKGQGGS